MDGQKAVVRKHLEKIAGVSRTWLEWSNEGSGLVKTLVVEVDFSTDPNEFGYRQNVMDAIFETARNVLENETTMIISHLKIVPKDR